MGRQPTREVRQAFVEMDVDGSGEIDKDESARSRGKPYTTFFLWSFGPSKGQPKGQIGPGPSAFLLYFIDFYCKINKKSQKPKGHPPPKEKGRMGTTEIDGEEKERKEINSRIEVTRENT